HPPAQCATGRTGRHHCPPRSSHSIRRRSHGASRPSSQRVASERMRVLVTGCAGYVGSVVTEALLARGHTVVVYDSLARGHRDAVLDGVPLVLADVLDAATLGGELREHRIDGVVHLAGLSLVAESMSDPARYYR